MARFARNTLVHCLHLFLTTDDQHNEGIVDHSEDGNGQVGEPDEQNDGQRLLQGRPGLHERLPARVASGPVGQRRRRHSDKSAIAIYNVIRNRGTTASPRYRCTHRMDVDRDQVVDRRSHGRGSVWKIPVFHIRDARRKRCQ